MGYPKADSRREFLQKPLPADQMPAIEGTRGPYSYELLFFSNLSEWPTEW